MLIRKLFKFEGAHVVRDCSSLRCKQSIHGHSYIVEVKLESNKIDNGQMVVDFGLLKTTIGEIIDSFDHSYTMWNKESDEFKKFIIENSSRYVIMPVSPSAEMLSLMFYAIIIRILGKTQFNNGEGHIKLHSVIVHETATGYAESFFNDWDDIWVTKFKIEDIIFSEGIQKEWKNKDMWNIITEQIKDKFKNPIVELKYNN